MKIFLAHAHEQESLGAEVFHRLRAAGYAVFFAPESLAPGGKYDLAIMQEIESSDLFLFLLSEDSVRPGSYALNELEVAKDKWPNPEGHVLAVKVTDVLPEEMIPPYLIPTTCAATTGNPAVSILRHVREFEREMGRVSKRCWIVRRVGVASIGGSLPLAIGATVIGLILRPPPPVTHPEPVGPAMISAAERTEFAETCMRMRQEEAGLKKIHTLRTRVVLDGFEIEMIRQVACNGKASSVASGPSK